MNNETIPFEESLFVNQNSKYILSILNEDVKSSSWLLTNGIHKIGRLDDKEIILDDITVSRNHGYISVDDNELTITDEQSTNGIFVNGELIKESKLTSGTRIQIEDFKFVRDVGVTFQILFNKIIRKKLKKKKLMILML